MIHRETCHAKESFGTKTVVLFLCHTMGDSAAAEFKKVSQTLRAGTELMLLFHKTQRNRVPDDPSIRSYIFTDDSLAALPYSPLFKNLIVPGSAHFPLMQFYRDHPTYEYYWLIEGDVRFAGNWKRLFEAFECSDDDFLSSYIREYKEDPNWYWWRFLSHPTQQFALAECVGSFNPIYRITARAIKHVHKMHCDDWRGHFEVLLPTLLRWGGFKLRDFGGIGSFVIPGDENKFYTSSTLRFRPVFRKVGWKWNKLYHPVKCP